MCHGIPVYINIYVYISHLFPIEKKKPIKKQNLLSLIYSDSRRKISHFKNT